MKRTVTGLVTLSVAAKGHKIREARTQPVAEKATMRRAPEEVDMLRPHIEKGWSERALHWFVLHDHAQVDTEQVLVRHKCSAHSCLDTFSR